jgi:alpha-beta hydrolase superfamily lysophospholipase
MGLFDILAADEGTWIERHWAMLTIMATILSLLIAAVWLFAYYVRICLKIFCDTPPPMSMNPVDFMRLEGDVVRFRSFDGTSLRGMLLEPPKGTDYMGTIVFCHEYGSDMYSCARYIKPLLEGGYSIFTFDFRAHGKSSGTDYQPLQWPSDKELGDAIGACAYIQSRLASEGKPNDIGIFGISRGAGAAILAAGSDPNIKAIVCDGAFSTEETLITLMKRWAHIFASIKLTYKNNPETFWRTLLWLMMIFAQPKLRRRFPSVQKTLRDMVPRPIYFIHGERDSYIRSDHTKVLYETAPSPKYIWIVEEAKHNQAVVTAPEAYAARTRAFFDKYLVQMDIPEQSLTTDPVESDVA